MAKVDPSNPMIADQEEEMGDLMLKAQTVRDQINNAMIERFKKIEQEKKKSEEAEQDRNLSETERMKRESEEREERERARLKEEEERRQLEQIEREKRQNEEKERQDITAKLRDLLGKRLNLAMVSRMSRQQLQIYLSETQAFVKKERAEKVAQESENQLFLSRALREAVIPSTMKFFDDCHAKEVEYWTEVFEKDFQQKKEHMEKMRLLHPLAEKLGDHLSIFAKDVVARRVDVIKDSVEARFQEAEKKRLEEEEERRKQEEEEQRRREEEERRRQEEEEERRREKEKAEEERRKQEEEHMERFNKMMKGTDQTTDQSTSRPRRRRGMPSATSATAATAATAASSNPSTPTPSTPAAPEAPAVSANLARTSTPISLSPSKPKEEEDEWHTVPVKPRRRYNKLYDVCLKYLGKVCFYYYLFRF